MGLNVLVTGGARRVGAGLVRALAADGHRVALHYRHSRDEADALATEIKAAGGRCETFQADLSDPAQRDALIPTVHAAFGGLDVLVNNASLFSYDVLAELNDASWQAHIDANLTAPVFLIRDFAAAVGEAGGVVINMLDQKVFAPNPDFFSYTAGKIGLAGLTATLAIALAPYVRVCGVAPGLLLPSGAQGQDDFERAWADAPLGRGPSIEDIARTVRYIIATPSLTGQVLTVDGGESLIRRARDVAFDGV